jgi:hypothetical protein
MSERSHTLHIGQKIQEWTLPTGAAALIWIAAQGQFAPGQKTSSAPESDAVTIGEVVRAVSRLEGAVTAQGSQITTGIQTMTKEIQDGQRRMDNIDLRDKVQDAILASHARSIEVLNAKVGVAPQREP